MPDSGGVIFLKEHSLPTDLKRLIQVCPDIESIFKILDTQFGDKTNELRILKRNIIQVPMLTPDKLLL